MELNDQKEAFSRAYVKAIASVAGYHCEDISLDRNSVDVQFKDVAAGSSYPIIEAQLKSTTLTNYAREAHIHYPLKIKNYNELRADSLAPRILICLLLPDSDITDSWINQTKNQLALKKCAYWLNLKELPDVSNVATVTVRIPLSNIFSSKMLKKLMEDVRTNKRITI